MMYTANGILDLRPKAFDAVCVGVATYKYTFTVRYTQMIKTALCQSVVYRIFVRVDRRIKRNGVVNEGHPCAGLRIWHTFCLDTTFALDSTYNWCFSSSTTPALTLADTSNVSLVNFNVTTIATKRIAAFIQTATDHLKHTPRRLVGNTKFALKLFRRDTRASLRHQVNR